MPGPTLSVRFWQKVDRGGPDDCWLWRASSRPSRGGALYGVIRVHGRLDGAHRVAYELERGPIPDGLTIDHLCEITLCVNPAHLTVATVGQNVLRGNSWSGRNARKTHCIHGHLYDEANTYRSKHGRHCRRCHRDREAARRERQRAA